MHLKQYSELLFNQRLFSLNKNVVMMIWPHAYMFRKIFPKFCDRTIILFISFGDGTNENLREKYDSMNEMLIVWHTTIENVCWVVKVDEFVTNDCLPRTYGLSFQSSNLTWLSKDHSYNFHPHHPLISLKALDSSIESCIAISDRWLDHR